MYQKLCSVFPGGYESSSCIVLFSPLSLCLQQQYRAILQNDEMIFGFQLTENALILCDWLNKRGPIRDLQLVYHGREDKVQTKGCPGIAVFGALDRYRNLKLASRSFSSSTVFQANFLGYPCSRRGAQQTTHHLFRYFHFID